MTVNRQPIQNLMIMCWETTYIKGLNIKGQNKMNFDENAINISSFKTPNNMFM